MELIKHECGVVLLRLLKPLSYYKEKYGTELYGLNKLYLLMEKQHNRGQEGAGLGCVKLDAEPGNEYIFRERAEGADAISKIFAAVHASVETWSHESRHGMYPPFLGEVYMGHLRYSTTGRKGISNVHPFMRRNNWSARNMLLCGNFNMTNVDDIFANITALGQHPRYFADGFILLEQLDHALDRENERLYRIHHDKEGMQGLELSRAIARDIDLGNLLHRCAHTWDGGYVICGIAGNGDMFAMRDPSGIRPAFYYIDDEVAVLASERPVIQTAFDLQKEDIRELEPGMALVVDRDSSYKLEKILEPCVPRKCTFERIYFSRGNDADIYRERKALGRLLAADVLEALDNDIDNTVISFVPNTAEVACLGLWEELSDRLASKKLEVAERLARGEKIDEEQIKRLMLGKVRYEKVAWKDIKLRTFIVNGEARNDLAAHVYDITYESLRPGVDNLVILDDSIVRGTTLKQSVIRILARLQPRKIVVVSSSPQVRYPDCYGIDMSHLEEFAAFRAAMELLHERGLDNIPAEVYKRCLEARNQPSEFRENFVKAIYAPFTDEEISKKMAEMLTPEGIDSEVRIVFQSLENLHKAVSYTGDWYFSGDYPTPGGNRMVNEAFISYYEGTEH